MWNYTFGLWKSWEKCLLVCGGNEKKTSCQMKHNKLNLSSGCIISHAYRSSNYHLLHSGMWCFSISCSMVSWPRRCVCSLPWRGEVLVHKHLWNIRPVSAFKLVFQVVPLPHVPHVLSEPYLLVWGRSLCKIHLMSQAISGLGEGVSFLSGK